MAIAAIVQARTGSARLPRKVLSEVAGKPLFGYLLERLARATSIDRIIVATSDHADDDAVASFCRRNDVECHRGPLDDVGRRVLDAARASRVDGFVRLSADSPLLDQALVDRAVALLPGHDLATNVHPVRTFPHGQSVEAFWTEAFERGISLASATADREHVTPPFYRHGELFAIAAFTHEPDLGDLQLAVDTPADLVAFSEIVGAMTRPHWEYGLDDVLELQRACAA